MIKILGKLLGRRNKKTPHLASQVTFLAGLRKFIMIMINANKQILVQKFWSQIYS